jgi:hypothetical protein
MPSLVLEVLQQCQLHGAPRAVLSTLAAYVDQYGAPVFPSLLTLAHGADVSERHVQRCLKQLATAGYLTITRVKVPGKQARNFYTLLFPWRLPAHKSTDTLPQKPAHKSTDIRCPCKDLKPQDKEEKKEVSTDTLRQISAEVLTYPLSPATLRRLDIPLGSAFAAICLGDQSAALCSP